MTLGNQLSRVEEIIETQDHIKNSFVQNDNKPLFKPFEFSKKFQDILILIKLSLIELAKRLKIALLFLKHLCLPIGESIWLKGILVLKQRLMDQLR